MQDWIIMSDTIVHIGMDDIDSPRGSCTTHFASILIEELSHLDVEWLDFPNLIRLNPNIPYRTRGNGAVALRFKTRCENIEHIDELLEHQLHLYVQHDYPNTNPGIVVLTDSLPPAIVDFSMHTLWRAMTISIARRLIKRFGIWSMASGNERGLIGALSSVGNMLKGDYTFEFLAYRHPDECDEERGVDPTSVIEMDRKFSELLFSNIDPENGHILIEPHGPDPVLFGIRGENAEDVIKAASLVRAHQKIDRWTVFRTNQGTDQHLTHHIMVKDLRPYMSARVKGAVHSAPRMTEGGHVFFSISDTTGTIDCAAYEPTGSFRHVVQKLCKDDIVIIDAGVRPASRTHGLTLNVEGLEIIKIAEVYDDMNPVCSKCGKRMKSAGLGKGFKCVRCGHKDPNAKKTRVLRERDIRPGRYLPVLSAQRHLTRPVERQNKTNKGIQYKMEVVWSGRGRPVV